MAPEVLAPDGFRSKVQRGALVTTSLPSLQNLVKRTPDAYAEEFMVQWNRWTRLALALSSSWPSFGDDLDHRTNTDLLYVEMILVWSRSFN